MMEKTWITLDKVIREVEKIKYEYYECYHMLDGLTDPSVLTQMSQRLLGQQMAIDEVINMCKRMQGCDGE